MSKQWLVTRHPGAVDWLRRQGIEAEAVAHLDVQLVQPGDIVYGTLPLHLAGQVCERRARFFYLAVDVPLEWRGRELDAGMLDDLGARLEEYQVRRCRDW